MKLKHLTLALLFGTISYSVSAQKVTEGIVTYKEKINVHANLTGSQVAMKAFIPEFISSKVQIHFKDSKAKIKKVKEKSNNGIMMSSSSSDMLMDTEHNKTYSFTKLNNGKFYTVDEFNPKKDKLKILDATKKIGGYTCKSAKMESENGIKFTVWYCTTLPKHFSPMGLLPFEGMVLEIESNKISYLFQSFEEKRIDKRLLLKPEGYTQVTKEQLIDLTEESIEDMKKSK